MKAFCPRCGMPSNVDLCDKCVLETTKFLSCPDKIEVTVCSVCGAKFAKGHWQLNELDMDELILNAVQGSLCIHNDLLDPDIRIQLDKCGATRYTANVITKGRFKGMEAEESCQVYVSIYLKACDRCSRIAGKYFEATIQVRGSLEKPSDDELEECERIAHSMAEASYRDGEQLSFIQEFKNTKAGIDIIVGSTQLGRQIAKALHERFGGKIQKSSKLVGKKDGRDVFRTTILIRFPRLKKGDIVSWRGDIFEVVGFNGKKTQLISLYDSRRSSVNEDDAEGIEILGNRTNSLKAIVVTADKNVFEIMDPENYRTAFASRPKGLDIKPGEEALVIRIVDGFIVLR
jgi:nonsense-mediated mRNA decay protein 3